MVEDQAQICEIKKQELEDTIREQQKNQNFMERRSPL